MKDTVDKGIDVIKNSKATVAKAYDEGASGAVKQVGVLLEDLMKAVRLTLHPVSYLAKLKDRLDERVLNVTNSIPIENQITPPISLVLSTLDKLKYYEQGDQLSELYIELLKRACDKERVDEVHPAFINIIPQLSLDEVLLIFYLSINNSKIGGYFISLQKGSYNLILNHLPLYEFEQPKSVVKAYTMKSSAVINNLFPLNKLFQPNLIDMNLSHLKALNLITNQRSPGLIGLYLTKEDQIENRLTKKDLIRYDLSLFGKLFAKACIPDDFNISNNAT